MIFFRISFSLLLVITAHMANAETLNVAVASNFKLTLEELSKTFNRNNKQNIQIISGSSGSLAQQISLGADIDVFMSADKQRPVWLEKNNLTIKDSRFTYAIGKLVLIGKDINTQLSAKDNIKKLATSTLAIANPLLAPYGKAAEECLNKWQINTAYKIVKANNISQAFHYAASHNANFGLVALAQIKQHSSPYVLVNNCHSPIEQQAVAIKKKHHTHKNTTAFMQFLKSKEAKAIIHQAGYQ